MVVRRFCATCFVCATVFALTVLLPGGLIAQKVVAAGSDDFSADRAMLLDSTVYVRFDVRAFRSLSDALAEGLVQPQTRVLIMEHPKGRLALVTDQMAYHHTAQGDMDGEPWMVSF